MRTLSISFRRITKNIIACYHRRPVCFITYRPNPLIITYDPIRTGETQLEDRELFCIIFIHILHNNSLNSPTRSLISPSLNSQSQVSLAQTCSCSCLFIVTFSSTSVLITLVDPVPGVNAHLLAEVEASSRCAGHLHNIRLVGTLEERARIPSGEQRVGPVLFIVTLHWQAVHCSRHQMGLVRCSVTDSRRSRPSLALAVHKLVSFVANASHLCRIPRTILASFNLWGVNAGSVDEVKVRGAHALPVHPLSSVAGVLARIHTHVQVIFALIGVIGDGGGWCVVGELFPSTVGNTGLEGCRELSANGARLARSISPTSALPVGAAVGLHGPLHPQLVASSTSWLDGRYGAAESDQTKENRGGFANHCTLVSYSMFNNPVVNCYLHCCRHETG